MVGICTLQIFNKFLDGTAFRFRDWGWAISPYKISLNLDYCSFLLANLRLGVLGFDEFLGSSWLWDSWMGFWEIWVSLVSCNIDGYKLIWAYLGFVFGNVLLMSDVDIYLCLIFLFAFWILRAKWFCFVLDWSEPKSIQNYWPEILHLAVAVSHFWVLCVEKRKVTSLFIHQFFIVNLWCPYFKMYWVWIIYL